MERTTIDLSDAVLILESVRIVASATALCVYQLDANRRATLERVQKIELRVAGFDGQLRVFQLLELEPEQLSPELRRELETAIGRVFEDALDTSGLPNF
jgi:hypothetical protein